MSVVTGLSSEQCGGQLTVWAGRASQTVSTYLASHHQAATEKGASAAADAAVLGLQGGRSEV